MDHKRLRTVAMSVLILAASLCPTVAIARNGDNIAAMRETSRAFSEVARKVVPAVVSIRVINTVQAAARYHSSPQEEEFFDRFFGRKYQRRSQEPQTQEGQGSGFIVGCLILLIGLRLLGKLETWFMHRHVDANEDDS